MCESYEGQAGALFQDQLGGIADQCFEFVERTCNDASDLRERWNNRIVLERSSLSELYLDGRIEILIYGEWGTGADQVDWFCRISPCAAVSHNRAPNAGVEPGHHGECDRGQDEVVFVVVVEGMEGPKRFVLSVGRTYLVEKKVCRSGEGGLYRLQIVNGRTAGGYKVFPFLSHGKVPVGLPLDGFSNAGSQMIKGSPEIVNGVSNDERGHFRDWFQRAISQSEPGWLRIGRGDIGLNVDAMPFPGQGHRFGNQLINVAVGPLNL